MIYIIITTSIYEKNVTTNNIVNYNDDHRKYRYINSISELLKLIENDPNIKPIIVENNGLRETYLNSLNCEICYTNNNEINCTHKGGNELLDIKEVINKYNIEDDDTIIKITGRYKLLNINLIDIVKHYSHNYDAFIKFYNVCTEKFMFNDCVLGCFAIKSKYMKGFNYNYTKSAECEFADYVRGNIPRNKIIEIKNLSIECCFAGNLRTIIV
jgi:hypothetical protein